MLLWLQYKMIYVLGAISRDAISIMYIIIWGIVFISFLILSIVFTKKANKQMEKDEEENWDFDYYWMPYFAVVSIVSAIIFGIIFIFAS